MKQSLFVLFIAIVKTAFIMSLTNIVPVVIVSRFALIVPRVVIVICEKVVCMNVDNSKGEIRLSRARCA